MEGERNGKRVREKLAWLACSEGGRDETRERTISGGGTSPVDLRMYEVIHSRDCILSVLSFVPSYLAPFCDVLVDRFASRLRFPSVLPVTD